MPHAKSCRWLEVKPSTFYKWLNRPPTPREQRRGELDAAVRESFDESGGTPGTYGSPRVWEDLVEVGWAVSKKTVAASMVRQGLQGSDAVARADAVARILGELVGRLDRSAPETWHGPSMSLYLEAVDRSAKLALDVGLADQRIRLEERHVELVARVLRGTLIEIGVFDRPPG